jgi:hypothetical protein
MKRSKGALRLFRDITKAAQQHGEDTGEGDHEIGDLHECLNMALYFLNDDQIEILRKILKDRELLGLNP